jgi:DME family drug/metabolite transporter
MSLAGFLYAIGAALTWGVVYTIDQRVLRGASPFALLFVDALLTTVLLLPIIFLEKGSLSSLSHTSTKVWFLILLSLVLAALANFFIFSSIKILGASTASVFEISYPFFVALFSYFVFGAELNFYFFIGALFIFAGSAVIIALA